MSEVRAVRLALHHAAVELEAAYDVARRERERQVRAASEPKSPFTHRSSRDLHIEAVRGCLWLFAARKELARADGALRHLDMAEPRLPHLKRITVASERKRTQRLLEAGDA